MRLIEPLVDFKVVRSWMEFCQQKHTRTCGAKDSLHDSLESITSLKLIDCHTRQLVPALNRPYITLSYIWGPNTKEIRYADVLPKDLPETIEDSIIVTQKLGLRYLWVDRYCINQQNKQEVAEQVARMDLIYRFSQVTIIAAAGEDPSYRLPGVRKRTRPPQPRGQIGSHFLVSTLQDPTDLIKRSTWMTRAWTYQEALLSHRRLVFTKQQVYFECRGMYCHETLNLPLQKLHTSNQQRFQSCFCSGTNLGIFPKLIGSTAWEVVERIIEYSRRSLTVQSDILNGFLGVLHAFEVGPQRIRHCLGVPTIPRPPKLSHFAKDETAAITSINESSRWSPHVGFCIGLCWHVETPAQRRQGFPSWSWTGWLGKCTWRFGEFLWRELQGDTDARLQVELQDNRLLDWNTVWERYDQYNLQFSNIIRISAWVTPMILQEQRESPEKPYCMAKLALADGGYLHWSFHANSNAPDVSSTNHNCLGIHLASGYPRLRLLHPIGPYLLVVHDNGNGIYERIGLDVIDGRNSSQFGPDGTMRSKDDDGYDSYDPKYGYPLRINPMHARLPILEKSWQEVRLG